MIDKLARIATAILAVAIIAVLSGAAVAIWTGLVRDWRGVECVAVEERR